MMELWTSSALLKFSISIQKIMSQHPSLKSSGGSVGTKRSVMKRFERVKLMKKRGQWKAGQSAIGLPKTLPEL
jgi:small basic protein (TIGR04137 family)